MENFTFFNKTKILFGKNAEDALGTELKLLGAKKILIHYGTNRIKESGLFEKVVQNITKESISFVELGGVVANPRLSTVREGIDIIRTEGIDFILAIGGGSVIDSAKAIAAGVEYDGDVWDFYEGKAILKKAMPIATILTIPAAGSEASEATVLTDEINKRKKAFASPKLQPRFSILNPELTLTLPDYQTACGATDMLAHVFERYFVKETSVDITDQLCLAHIKSIIKNAKLLLKNPDNYNYRAEIMLAGYIAHNGWLNVGRGAGDWSSHAIEHELSAEYDIAHGAGLAIIFPAWMKYVYKENINKFLLLGKEVFEITTPGEEGVIETINQLKLFYQEIGMPTRMKDININNPDIQKMAEHAVGNSQMGNFKTLKKQDIEEIYKLAL
ncbi:MAG: iron-containing alcohol dehydrogenase [Nanoarchaeota archaeon]|jgi:alcohol dehydrogenase YqhD (iron-dependent ADH family)|nr:iron-containing alcohol dehydrogenase [Nanoarchaeota archaeon]